jgi:secreted PhoX family phosphatase
LASPTSIAVDSGGNVAIGTTSTALCLTSNALSTPSCGSDGSLIGTLGVATNGTIEAYVGSTTGTSVTGVFDLTSNTTGPVNGGGISLPTAVAFDGAGHTWIANTTGISSFNGTAAVSPASGYGSLNSPSGIAIDASGNVWTANTGSNSLSIFVGLATPVATPIAVNVGP